MNPFQPQNGPHSNRSQPSSQKEQSQSASPLPSSQNLQKLQQQQSSNQYNLMMNKKPPSFEFVVDPTKRIRHNQHHFTESELTIREASFGGQALKREDYLVGSEGAHQLSQRIPVRDVGTKMVEQNLFKPQEIQESHNLNLFKQVEQTHGSARFEGVERANPLRNFQESNPRNIGDIRNSLNKEANRNIDLTSVQPGSGVMRGLSQGEFGGNQYILPPSDLFKNAQFNLQTQEQILKQFEQQKNEQMIHQRILQQMQQQQHVDLLFQQLLAQQIQQNMKIDQMNFLRAEEAYKQRMIIPDPVNTFFPLSNFNTYNPKLKAFNTAKDTSSRQVQQPDLKAKKHPLEVLENVIKNDDKDKYFEAKIPRGAIKIENFEDLSKETNTREQNQTKSQVWQSTQKGSKQRENEEKKIDSLNEVKKEVKKRVKNQKVSSTMFETFAEKQQNEKLEPRRKNKWQLQTEQLSGVGSPTQIRSSLKPSKITALPNDRNTGPSKVGAPNLFLNEEAIAKENAKRIQELKQERLRMWIQEAEDQSKIDYDYLLSLKITNDPEYTGYDNDNKNFKIVNKNNNVADFDEEGKLKAKNTRIGWRYQTDIPELDFEVPKTTQKRKFPELVWNPKAVSENDLRRYFNDLCEALHCDNVNQERALKLLKRKNFKRDRVKVNISKNEKFYSSFLIVSENPKTNVEENLIQKTDF